MLSKIHSNFCLPWNTHTYLFIYLFLESLLFQNGFFCVQKQKIQVWNENESEWMMTECSFSCDPFHGHWMHSWTSNDFYQDPHHHLSNGELMRNTTYQLMTKSCRKRLIKSIICSDVIFYSTSSNVRFVS